MSIKYTDINADYTRNDSQAYVVDMEAIKQKLSRLFSTKIGSVPFNRSYGSSLWGLLFENGTQMEIYQIELLIYQDITMWVPEVSVAPGSVTITREDSNTYSLEVSFTVPSLNDASGSLKQIISSK